MLAKTRWLEARGAPYVARVHGKIKVYGLDALLMDSYPTADRFFRTAKKIGKNNYGLLYDVSYLTPRSIESLEATRAWLIDQRVAIVDMQFLVADDGTFYLADYEELLPGQSPLPEQLQLIDECIALVRSRSRPYVTPEGRIRHPFDER